MSARAMLFSAVVICLSFVLIGPALSVPSWQGVDKQSSPTEPRISITAQSPGHMTIQVALDGFWLENKNIGGEPFQYLSIPGQSSTFEDGRASLPVLSSLVCIPAYQNLRMRIVDQVEETWGGLLVEPWGLDPKANFDLAKYSKAGGYPEFQVELAEPGYWRDLHVANLRIQPFRYDATHQELTMAKQLTIELDFEPTESQSPSEKRFSTPQVYKNIYEKSVINYRDHPGFDDPGEKQSNKNSSDYDYLIIVNDGLAGSIGLSHFVNWKENCGWRVHTVTTSSIPSSHTSAGLKAYIQQQYSDYGILFVLLLGDEYAIPVGSFAGPPMVSISDYFYTLLNIQGVSDNYPDIALGRFHANSTGSLSIMLDRSIAYEQVTPASSWYDKALLVGGAQHVGVGQLEWFMNNIWNVNSQTYQTLDPDFSIVDGTSAGVTNDTLIDAINEGHRIVLYRGHGYSGYWSNWNMEPVHNDFGADQVEAINAGSQNPVVLSIACDTANLTYNNFLGGKFMTPQAGGATAFLGGTGEMLSNSNMDFSLKIFDEIFDEGIPFLGLASNSAAVKMLQKWGYYGNISAKRVLLLGDPSLRILTQSLPSNVPTLTYPHTDQVFFFQEPPVLQWTRVPNATHYQLQAATDADFSQMVIETTITGEETTAPTRREATLFWRVRAYLDDGNNSPSYGPWSQTSRFVYQYAVANILRPRVQREFFVNDDITFMWEPIPDHYSYTLQISTDRYFGTVDIEYPNIIFYGVEDEYALTKTISTPDPIGPGTWYWRVKGNSSVSGWTPARPFEVTTVGPTSCPVLFTWAGDTMTQENPLLTACERSGYRDIVTDYYTPTVPIQVFNNRLLLQLRELEDEITYLQGFELLAVDHPENTRIGCTIDGTIFCYGEQTLADSIVDQNGTDCGYLLLERDQQFYTSSGPGELLMEVDATGGDLVAHFSGYWKPPCIHNTPLPENKNLTLQGETIKTTDLTVQIRNSDKSWSDMPTIPTRDNPSEDFLFIDSNLADESGKLQIRVSWQGSYNADFIQLFRLSPETPLVRTCATNSIVQTGKRGATTLQEAPGAKNIITLRKDETLDFSFQPLPETEQGISRNFIIKATGRYQPDYEIHTDFAPSIASLHQNHPNPFNPQTRITYDLDQSEYVELTVFDVLGHRVRTLVSEQQNAGLFGVVWNGVNDRGRKVASGVYYYRLTTKSFSDTKKMLLIK